jgi:hypothetical protein
MSDHQFQVLEGVYYCKTVTNYLLMLYLQNVVSSSAIYQQMPVVVPVIQNKYFLVFEHFYIFLTSQNSVTCYLRSV